MIKDKEQLISNFIEIFKNSFVDEFDKMNKGREIINNYLKEINFNYEFDYNTFCIEFLDITEKSLKNINVEDFAYINIVNFISEILNIMIKNKINHIIKDDSYKNAMLILNDLKKYLAEKDKK